MTRPEHSPPLRTELRLFEPQLSSALGWLLALVLMLPAAVALRQPPELLTLLFALVALMLGLRVVVGYVAHGVFRYLVGDHWRTLGHVAAIVLALIGCAVSLRQVGALPGCAPAEALTELDALPLGPFHVVDIAAALLAMALIVGEPLLFRQTLAVQFLWPSSPSSYWLRWSVRVLAPTLILWSTLGMHRVAAARLWGPYLDARQIAAAVMDASEGGRVGLADERALEQEATVTELVNLAMCQSTDELATRLVDTMHASRRRIDLERWRELEDYVYAKLDGED